MFDQEICWKWGGKQESILAVSYFNPTQVNQEDCNDEPRKEYSPLKASFDVGLIRTAFGCGQFVAIERPLKTNLVYFYVRNLKQCEVFSLCYRL